MSPICTRTSEIEGYRIMRADSENMEDAEELWPLLGERMPGSSCFAKHFQNRIVSSAAAETTVWPSGLMARCSTRAECPLSSAREASVGYFQIVSW